MDPNPTPERCIELLKENGCSDEVIKHCMAVRDVAEDRGDPPGSFGVVAMGIFLGILVIGFIYEWKKGALEWE